MKNFSDKISEPIFKIVGQAADELSLPCYVVGGYVRDLLLKRPSKDIDFVSVGPGISLAEKIAHQQKGAHLAVYKTYGTAQVKLRSGLELEFVGARKESYHSDSRNPDVETGTLEEDISRRDFTINAMALCVNHDNFGELVDMFNGLEDLQNKIIRTPLDPDITFSDDPLRMMRGIRFATQLNFRIAPETLDAITRNAERIKIITRERIITEINKIMASAKPSIGWILMLKTGLLEIIFPELAAMSGVEVVNGRGHKDNFYHTMEVLDNVAAKSDNLWLRWSALLHDIAKPVTKRWDDKLGWTFHNHNFIGSKMIPVIFRRMKLPTDERMRYVQKMVELHMRPIALVEDEVTDSAVRRLANYAEDDLQDLMILARADITSKNQEKKQRFLDNFDLVESKFKDISAKDRERARRAIIRGDEIMHIFNLPPCPMVGTLTKEMLQAQRDDVIQPPTRENALKFLFELAERLGVERVNPPFDIPDEADSQDKTGDKTENKTPDLTKNETPDLTQAGAQAENEEKGKSSELNLSQESKSKERVTSDSQEKESQKSQEEEAQEKDSNEKESK